MGVSVGMTGTLVAGVLGMGTLVTGRLVEALVVGVPAHAANRKPINMKLGMNFLVIYPRYL